MNPLNEAPPILGHTLYGSVVSANGTPDTMATFHYHQYGDLPQIPTIPEDYHQAQWVNSPMAYRPFPYHADEEFGYNGIDGSGAYRSPAVERFLVDPSPLTHGVLQAKLEHGIPVPTPQFRQYEQWSTPDLVRYDSPDATSVSENSSYATQNEVRSPHPFPAMPYSSPEETTQLMYPYQSSDQFKDVNLALAGGSINPREIEYEHEPELEPTVEDTDGGGIKPEAAFEQEPAYTKMDTTPDQYKTYPEARVSTSLRDAESVQPMDPDEEESSDPDYTPGRASRRRRSSASTSSSGRNGQRRRSNHGRKNSSSTPNNGNRINKRSGRAAASFGAGRGSIEVGSSGESQRHFPCPLATYGCQSTFSSKNEWKRHVSTQHIKLGFWRCDLCATTIDPHDDQTFYHNDFNRKDLFTQHLRRMHAAPASPSSRNHKDYQVTEDNIAEHQTRCFQKLRGTPPKSSCLYCDEMFTGVNSWDQRMEHIGRHLEKDRNAGSRFSNVAGWNVDKDLERWLETEGIIALDRNQSWKIGDGRPKRLLMGGDVESDDEA